MEGRKRQDHAGMRHGNMAWHGCHLLLAPHSTPACLPALQNRHLWVEWQEGLLLQAGQKIPLGLLATLAFPFCAYYSLHGRPLNA